MHDPVWLSPDEIAELQLNERVVIRETRGASFGVVVHRATDDRPTLVAIIAGARDGQTIVPPSGGTHRDRRRR